jgi:hypothetical protein
LEGKNEDENSEEKDKPDPPLEPEYLIALLDFITKMVDQEKTQERQLSANRVAIIASSIAFLASIGATVVVFAAK